MSCCRVGVLGLGKRCVMSTFSSNHNGFGLSEMSWGRRRWAGNGSTLHLSSRRVSQKLLLHVHLKPRVTYMRWDASVCFGQYGEDTSGCFFYAASVQFILFFFFFFFFFLFWLHRAHKSMQSWNRQVKLCVILAVSLWGPVISASTWLHRLGTWLEPELWRSCSLHRARVNNKRIGMVPMCLQACGQFMASYVQ